MMIPQGSSTKESLFVRLKTAPKWLSFFLLFIILVVTPITILFLDNFIKPAQSWFDNAWEYRKPVDISYTGAPLSNYDVLVSVDTQTLIGENKIQADCDDIRFVDSDDTTQLQYWIETGCNTTDTQIWVRVPDVPDGGTSIYMYYGNGSAANAEEVWNQNIYTLSSVACPAGWVRNIAADGKLLRGGAVYGITGGSTSHSHSNASCATGAPVGATGSGGNAGSVSSANASHTHTGATVTVETASNVIPPFRDLLLCGSSDFSLKSGLISMFSGTIPSGWTRFTDLDDKFVKSEATAGGSGGSETHTHSFTGGTLTSSAGTINSTSTAFASGGTVTTSGSYTLHTFTSTGTFTAYGSGNVDVLVVGGGGGGYAVTGAGRGGGGGQVKEQTVAVSAGTGYVATVGAGGAAHYAGTASSFSSLISSAPGQGAAGGFASGSGYAGGAQYTDYDCYAPNCVSTGGGGGAGGAGGGGANGRGGLGGTGVYSNIMGAYYGGGGGGGVNTEAEQSGWTGGWGQHGGGRGRGSGTPSTAGTANTGAGGGGGGNTSSYGKAGGSGIIVVRYPTALSNIFASIHTHTTNNGTTSSANNLPPYQDILFASKDADGSIPTGTIMIVDSVPPLGWNRISALDDKFPRGAAVSGGTGGSSTHSHSLDITTGVPSATTSSGANSVSLAGATHTHSCSATTDSQSSLPPYFDVLFAQKNDNTAYGVSATIGAEASNVPAAPVTVAAEALSTSSIRWNFIDSSYNETGFKIVDSFGAVKADCPTPNISYCDETGLSVNTQYTRYVIAYNANGDSDAAYDTIRYTLANTPTLSVSSVTAGGINVVTTGVTNLGVDGTALFYNCIPEDCDPALSQWIIDDQVNFTGLSMNTQYTFSVVARNGDGVETAESDPVVVYTVAEVPDVYVSSLATNQISLDISNGANLSSDSSGIYFECVSQNCPAGGNEWVSVLPYSFTGLQPNTLYTFKAKVRNGDALETLFSPDLPVYTSVYVPSMTASPVDMDTVKVTVSPNSNPSNVEYSIFETIKSRYVTALGTLSVTPEWNIYLNWNSENGVEVSGFNPGELATFFIIARNGDSVEVNAASNVSTYTLWDTPTDLTGSSTGPNTIRWAFINPNGAGLGVRVYDGNGNIMVDCPSFESPYCDETGLNPNSSYTRKVKVYNANTESAFSTTDTEVTKAAVPSLTNVTAGLGTIAFGTNLNSNPDGTEIAVYEINSGKYVDPVTGTLVVNPTWFARSASDSDISITGLLPNTQYSLETKARNSVGVETLYSVPVDIYTHATGPTLTSITSVSNTSLRITINTQSNPVGTQYAVHETTTNKFVDTSTGLLADTPAWGDYTQWGSGSGLILSGLSANVRYTFEVKAQNNDGVETGYSPVVSRYTRANTPALTSLIPSSSSVLVAVVDSASNPASTEFQLREEASGLNIDVSNGTLTSSTSTSWGTYVEVGEGSGLGLTGLSPNTLYSIKARARNGENVVTDFSVILSKYTHALVPAAPTVTQVSSDTVNVKVQPNGNPSNTEFALYNSTTSVYMDVDGSTSVTPVWAVYNSWGGSNGLNVSGLSSGTAYQFVSKARNGDGVETSFSLGEDFVVSLNAPTIGTPTLLSSSSIQWNFTDNEANDHGYRVFDENGVQKVECVGAAGSSCTEYGLVPNTQYTRKIAAYNTNGRSDFSQTVSIYTPAAQPVVASASASSTSQLNVKIGNGLNPLNTKYLLTETVSGLYVDYSTGDLSTTESWGTYSNFGGSNGVTIRDLFANAQYSFAVKARNEELLVTGNSSIVEVYTLAVVPASPNVTALSESKIKVIVDNGGNPEVTTFALKDVSSGLYFNFASGAWQLSKAWGSYTNWGRDTGFEIPGLGINTQYEYAVYTRNGDNIESAVSQATSAYTLAAIPGKAVMSQNTINSSLLALSSNGNPSTTEFSVVEVSSNRFIDPRTGELVSTSKWGRASEFGASRGVQLKNLSPGGKYEFVVKARNGDGVETAPSQSLVNYTLAAVPGVLTANTVTVRAVRISIDTELNDPSVEYSIYEESSRRYLDKSTGLLIDNVVWGTYSEFGGSNGITIYGLSPVTDYSFRINARNAAGVQTGLGTRRILGTNAIIENVPLGLELRLKENGNIDPTEDVGSQRGVKDIRVMKGEFIIADVPVEFNANRDWSEAVITNYEGKVVINLPDDTGFVGTYTMYVPKDETNRFKLCTKAESIEDVNSDCAGSVIFSGPYPQTIEINGKEVEVSVSVINGVSYWVVKGLTGTGGLGEKVESNGEVVEEPEDNEPPVEEEPEPTPVTGNQNPVIVRVVQNVVNSVTQAAPEQAAQAIDGVKIALDNTVGTLPEPQLTVVTATTTAATVTIGLAALGGGFSSLPYYVVQISLSILSFLGFRKRGKPYGYVYDSVTKEPLSRAIVRIYDINDKLAWTDVTDVYGAFNVELPKGRYKLLVKKGGYKYPTELIKGMIDYPLEPIYKGDLIRLSRKEDLNVIIPLDPLKVDRSRALSISARSRISFLLKLLHFVVFMSGLIFAIYAVTRYQTTMNFIIICLYIPAVIMLFSTLFGNRVKFGEIRDVKGKTVPNLVIAIKELKFDRYVGKRITDRLGRYRFIMYKGAYELELVSSEYKVVKYEDGSGVINISEKGSKVIAKDITVRRK
ncbi:MAG: hypothetical protein UT34_C0001G0511 [candidate division WS6 bacterium GW2011_GWF2_39_15]|uniref:Fibronectin type-III domain-containing protein n=1 Tax=candidate division WS6 bacterium GW2011_GWF2_39_15 TaxID=1619100 RepID=A0A0G0Q7P3_9BACT|nr:MAG: hypothetical protein UT34_C0001G0511 [candidate division WS6 bacterium GW2011_GWF2_39_15]